MTDATAAANGIRARYSETNAERILEFDRAPGDRSNDADRQSNQTATITQNSDGYAMLVVKHHLEGVELERYYGFEMALDHAAELLGVPPAALPIPAPATDMGM